MTYQKLPALAERMISLDRIPEGYRPILAFAKGDHIVVFINQIPEDQEEYHNCDWEGCGSLNHVLTFNVKNKYEAAGVRS